MRCAYCGNTIIPPESLATRRDEVDAQQVSITTSAATIDFQEYRDLLAQGEKIEAIKRLRRATGLGLKQSKEIIEALERGEDMSALAALLGGMLPDQQAAEAMQAINLEGQSISPASVKRTVKIAGASLTCGMLALIGFILLVTVVPVVFALVVGGGPLAPLWNQIDPLSPVGIELRFGEEWHRRRAARRPARRRGGRPGQHLRGRLQQRAPAILRPGWQIPLARQPGRGAITSRRWKSPATAPCWWWRAASCCASTRRTASSYQRLALLGRLLFRRCRRRPRRAHRRPLSILKISCCSIPPTGRYFSTPAGERRLWR